MILKPLKLQCKFFSRALCLGVWISRSLFPQFNKHFKKKNRFVCLTHLCQANSYSSKAWVLSCIYVLVQLDVLVSNRFARLIIKTYMVLLTMFYWFIDVSDNTSVKKGWTNISSLSILMNNTTICSINIVKFYMSRFCFYNNKNLN